MIFKTADGAAKKFTLPIESIKEDILEDPEAMLAEIEGAEQIDEEDRAKLLSALKEMRQEKQEDGE